MTPTLKECKFCGIESENGTFCSLEHQLEYAILELKREKESLEQQLHLLNSIRTGHWPDMDKTIEGNEQQAIFSFKTRAAEMTGDQIFVYSKMVRAIDIECELLLRRQGIKSDHDKKAREGFKQAIEKRDETTLPASPLAKAKEKFIRENKKQGFSEAECEKMWKTESVKEKAILGFMKMPGITREMAETMAMASMTCSCGHTYKQHKVGGSGCLKCTCESFTSKGA
jgi:hypothetical protein